MLREIVLYGDLEEKYGKVHKFDVSCVGEAIRALKANFPGFIQSIDKEAEYNVVRGEDLESGEALDEETISMKFKKGSFHIAPAIIGKKAGVFATVLGAVLIVVGAVLSVYGYGAIGVPMMKMGAALMIGGICMMLTPVPGTPEYSERENPDERASFLFDGAKNTTEQGGAIPVIYGRVSVGSTIISSALDVEDL